VPGRRARRRRSTNPGSSPRRSHDPGQPAHRRHHGLARHLPAVYGGGRSLGLDLHAAQPAGPFIRSIGLGLAAFLQTACFHARGCVTPALGRPESVEDKRQRRRTDPRLRRRGAVHRVRRRCVGTGPSAHGTLQLLWQRPSFSGPRRDPLPDTPREDTNRERAQRRPTRPLPIPALSQALPGIGPDISSRRDRSLRLGRAGHPPRGRCRSRRGRGGGRQKGRRLPSQARATAPPRTHSPFSVALPARDGYPVPGGFWPPQGRSGEGSELQDRHHRGFGRRFFGPHNARDGQADLSAGPQTRCRLWAGRAQPGPRHG